MGNPFKGVSDKVAEHNRVMQQWMAGYNTGSERRRGDTDAWIPATDIFLRHDGDLVVLAELPGVRREDVNVSLSGGDLIIHGEKDGHEEEAEYYTSERYSGSFRRTISLPDGLAEDRVSCHFEGCILEIVLQGYSEVLEAKRIEIGGE
jgi:HSP20 family protein